MSSIKPPVDGIYAHFPRADATVVMLALVLAPSTLGALYRMAGTRARIADATVVVLALSTLGALYRWPDLRPVADRLLSWFGGLYLALYLALLALTILWTVFAEVEALQKRSPLYTAAQAGNHPRVVELLQYQHVRSDIGVGMRSGFGMLASKTPLYAAAENGHTEVVDWLLKAGANPNAPLTFGLGVLASKTPLFAAADKGHTGVVAALLKAGANPNTPYTRGLGMLWSITPLVAAAENDHTETHWVLAVGGANLSDRPEAF